SWYGGWHAFVLGSGTQTVGTPFDIGIPSAPGYVPKYESNDRFSCMITTTCRIRWIPDADPAAEGEVHAAPTRIMAARTAAVPAIGCRFTRAPYRARPERAGLRAPGAARDNRIATTSIYPSEGMAVRVTTRG